MHVVVPGVDCHYGNLCDEQLQTIQDSPGSVHFVPRDDLDPVVRRHAQTFQNLHLVVAVDLLRLFGDSRGRSQREGRFIFSGR